MVKSSNCEIYELRRRKSRERERKNIMEWVREDDNLLLSSFSKREMEVDD
jgi:hypothetical protein